MLTARGDDGGGGMNLGGEDQTSETCDPPKGNEANNQKRFRF